ncbi:YgiT-type zinc finger protein [Candidatus Woesearchaeota archaeon]|nr:YgiT-type zinc finger protein [Candidatus Woesearchaeota archaeon]
MKKCYICNEGTLEKRKVDYFLLGENLGKFEAEVCNKCGEQFFDEEVDEQITKRAKEKGLWGIMAKTKIGQAGSTLDIRLPKKIIEFLDLKKGEEVIVYPEGKKRLIIET